MRLSARAALLALLAAVAYAAPVPRPPHELIPSASWLTFGDDGGPSSASTVVPHVARQLHRGHLQHVSARQTSQVITTTSAAGTTNSKFKVTIVDKPAGLDITAAVQAALAVVEAEWTSKVEVTTRIAFSTLGGPNVLANGGGTFYVRMSQFERPLTVASAEAVEGKEMNVGQNGLGAFDVLITLNDNVAWHTDPATAPDSAQYDLLTVLLHEFYHNLLFAGKLEARPSVARGEQIQIVQSVDGATRFDAFLADGNGCSILGYAKEDALANRLNKTTAELLGDALTNNKLYFADNAGTIVAKLYAPRRYKLKSSTYHIDFSSEPNLMNPTIQIGSRINTIADNIKEIQRLILSPTTSGAKTTNCALGDPSPAGPLTANVPTPPETHSDGGVIARSAAMSSHARGGSSRGCSGGSSGCSGDNSSGVGVWATARARAAAAAAAAERVVLAVLAVLRAGPGRAGTSS